MDSPPLIRIDSRAHQVWQGDRRLHLTRLEFRLLRLLAASAGFVVEREDIVREVWQTEWLSNDKTLDMHISWLRRKLGDDAARPRYITTIRGVGFRLEPGTAESVEPTVEPQTRVVLVKPGDVLVFGNVGVPTERVAATARALRDQLRLAEVVLFQSDIDMEAMSGRGDRG